MKGVVVGLGSMGKRRIRLMRSFFPDVELCGVDGRTDRREETANLFGVPVYAALEEAVAAFVPEVGFVCTSPLSHAAIITAMLQADLHVFTEINLVADGYEENQALAKQRGRHLFLSSTPLYRKEIEHIEMAVAASDGPLVYRYHVGQYLPDWHPWENYSDFFVGDARTNGCREIFGIELPWIFRVFGPVTGVETTSRRQTALKITFPDCWLVTLQHENGTAGQLAVDVVSRKAVRDLEIYGENLCLHWNGTPDSLVVFDPETKEEVAVNTYESVRQDFRYAANIIENAYVDELAAFFAALRGESVRCHTFADDRKVIDLMDRIEGVNA